MKPILCRFPAYFAPGLPSPANISIAASRLECAGSRPRTAGNQHGRPRAHEKRGRQPPRLVAKRIFVGVSLRRLLPRLRRWAPRRPRSPSSPSSACRADGAETLQMMKSRSMVGLAPVGKSTWLMVTESPISRPVRSTVTFSGMSPAVTINSISLRTTVSTPPRLMPGLFLAHEFDGDEQVDLGGPAQAQQVEMRGQVLDHVALHVAADHPHVVMAVDLEVEQRRLEPPRLELLDQLVEGNLDGKRVVSPPNTIPGTMCARRTARAAPLPVPVRSWA